jgi:hypothetical protein
MMKLCAGLAVACVCVPGIVFAQSAPSAEAQIAMAVHPAPEERRAGAAVLGYDSKGALVQLRAGTNDLICLADNPKVEGVSVACYHKDLEPFMARGRELVAQGVTEDKVRTATRFKEIESGKLPMPKEARMLYVTTGKAYDAASNTIAESYTRWVIYVPFATPETTGLATKPTGPGSPWLMDPGTPGAHIMISPPRGK